MVAHVVPHLNGLELRGVARARRREIALHWLEAVQLLHAQHHWPWQLSQGMRQRVALARTWALDPAVLLMDEPFAALDVNTRLSVQKKFLELWQAEEHRTVVFVTHDLGEAIALADRGMRPPLSAALRAASRATSLTCAETPLARR